jgi:outer membrane lipoprotein-sorting protein
MKPNNKIEQLVRAFEVASHPETRAQTLRDMLAAQAESKKVHCISNKSSIWRTIMKNRITKFGIAATIILVLGLIAWFLPGTSKSGLAFAQVIRQLNEVKSMAYKITTETANEKVTMEIMSLEPGRTRMVMPGGIILITDLLQKKSLTLVTLNKLAIFQKIDNQPNFTSPNLLKNIISISKKFTGKDLSRVAGKDLGLREVEGRTAKGFQVPANGMEIIYWVDPDTGYPIRIEFAGNNMGTGAVRKMIFRDLKFDVNLDESLFSLTVPKGYTIQTLKAQTPAQSKAQPLPSEKDLVEALQVLCDINGGVFHPDLFTINPEKGMNLGNKVIQTMKKALANHPDQTNEICKKYNNAIWATQFSQFQDDWHYVGQNVKRGETGTPICWWKPKGSKTYRIMYADLTIKDVAPDQLPAHK